MRKELKELLSEVLAEDEASSDITSSFTTDKQVKAEIVCASKGILAGSEEVNELFKFSQISASNSKSDGDELEEEDVIYKLEGSSAKLHSVERSALNILAHMSGIATLTAQYVTKAKQANLNVEVAATRKTIPLARYFEKRAVVIGGGQPHRYSLADAILIKDNHLKMFDSITQAIRAAKNVNHPPIEIEVEDSAQAMEAAKAGADIIMLDNFSPTQINDAIKDLGEGGVQGKVKLEASGGITLENIAEYAATGVDVISVGRLTMSAPALDFSLNIID